MAEKNVQGVDLRNEAITVKEVGVGVESHINISGTMWTS